MACDESWDKIAVDFAMLQHDFGREPFSVTAKQIKRSCHDFPETGQKEVRLLCKQDTRESRPRVFREHGLFILPVRNGTFNILKGEGYVDIPSISGETTVYRSKLDFRLDSSVVGDSEMQHLDYAYATSLIRTFLQDDSLVLTIRGRKYTPEFSFRVNGQRVTASSVQTEVDAGYEGKTQIALIEAKSANTTNVIIRQLYYPFRQWQTHTAKRVVSVFFQKDHASETYSLWEFEFQDPEDYNSIAVVRSQQFRIE